LLSARISEDGTTPDLNGTAACSVCIPRADVFGPYGMLQMQVKCVAMMQSIRNETISTATAQLGLFRWTCSAMCGNLMSGATAPQDLAIMFIDEETRFKESQWFQDDKTPAYGQPDIMRLLDHIAVACPVCTE
jgi:hypothetical protein